MPEAVAAVPVAPAAVAPPAKLSLAAELAAALAAPPAAEETTPVVAETPVVVEGAPAAEAAAIETPAVVETKPEPSMARRLAALAAADKRLKAEKDARAKADADRAVRDAEMLPFVERMKAAKSAKNKREAVKLALGYNDEETADLFLELNEAFQGGEKVPAKDPAAELDKAVARKVEELLKARDADREAEVHRTLETGRAGYYAETMEALTAQGDAFPHVAIAPPAQVDITAISEALMRANHGVFPRPEEVLRLIEDERRENLGKRLKRPEGTPGTSTAPATAGEESGKKKAPIRSNDVAVVPGAKLTLEQEFALELKRAGATQ